VAKRIGELLVEGGVLTQSQLEQALFAQRKDGRKLGLLLVELGFVTEVQVTQTLSRQLSVPWVSLYHVNFSRSLLNLVPREIAEKYCLVPIFVRRVRKQGETLYIAMDDPTHDSVLQEVAEAAAMPVKPMIACPGDIRAAIRVYYLGEEALPPPSLVPSPSLVPPASSPAPSVPKAVSLAAAPPLPERARSKPDTKVESQPPASVALASVAPPSAPASSKPQPSGTQDSRELPPAVRAEEREAVIPMRRSRPKMVSLTLLDGTTISIPAPPNKQGSSPEIERPASAGPAAQEFSVQLTARDLVSALRAVAHGADASEILGAEPRWEALFSALLSILLRKGLIADWEFVEEFRRI
jgi:type IV pilus assembly protein PilB